MNFELTAAVVLIGTLIVLLATGLELIVAFGLTATIGLVFFWASPPYQLAWTVWDQLNVHTLTAVPLFIFMGAILGNTGVCRYLFDAVNSWSGRLPGSLALSSIVAQGIFGAMCGSTMATAATFTTIVFPEMERKSYDARLGLGSIAVGGILAPLIPPSIIMIIYGAWQGISVIRLFAAGVIPGIILATLYIITILIWVKLNPSLAPIPNRSTWREKFTALCNLIPWFALIATVLGVIFTGIMTPTEAAAGGAFLSIIISLGYRELNWAIFKQSYLDAVRITAMVMIIFGFTVVLSCIFQKLGVIQVFGHFFLNLPFGRNGILALLFLMYLFLGMWFESWGMMLLTFPFVMPVILGLGINPVWWGVFYVVVGEFSVVTPPFGLSLFVIQGISGKPMETIVYGALRFVGCIITLEVLLVAFPEIALWLPGIL